MDVPSGGTLTLVAGNTPAPVPAAVAAPIPVAVAPDSFSVASIPSPAPVPMAAPAPVPSGPVDAYIDLNGGPYPNQSVLTTGTAQAWYNSPTAIQAFGGVPNAQQQANFDQSVLSRVQQTFQLSGMNPSITIDPAASALHTVSVVSNTGNRSDADAIGMTEVGGNGFGYIDKLASLNLSPDQLAWAVAHNVSHELMHAFGIGSHPDQTGNYIDSASASASLLTDPTTTFSPSAVQLIKSTNYGVNPQSSAVLGAEKLSTNPNHVGPACTCVFCRGIFGNKGASPEVMAAPVPEPSTILIWGASLAAAGFAFRRNRRTK